MKDIITLTISSIALLISVVTFGYQYVTRNNLKFTAANVYAIVKDTTKPYTKGSAMLKISILFYNGGNRQVAINEVSLELYDGDPATLAQSKPSTCVGNPTHLLQQVSTDTGNEIVFAPFILSPESISHKEYDFDLTYFEKETTEFSRNGLVCMGITASDVKGATTKITKPIYVLGINMNTADPNKNRFHFGGYPSDLSKIF